MTKRQQYRNIVNLYFSTILGYEITKVHNNGFFYIGNDNQEKSVYTEYGEGSLSTLCKIPYAYNGKDVSVMSARTDFYVAVFPEMNTICIGRPKKLRLWLASSKSQWDLEEGENGLTWVAMKPKALADMFDKVQRLDKK